jgi:hypothetical protein
MPLLGDIGCWEDDQWIAAAADIARVSWLTLECKGDVGTLDLCGNVRCRERVDDPDHVKKVTQRG